MLVLKDHSDLLQYYNAGYDNNAITTAEIWERHDIATAKCEFCSRFELTP